jgi:hypothetical protein
MKIAIVSAGSPDYDELRQVTQPTRDRYAEKHGYDSWFFETPANMGDACKRKCYEALWGRGYDVLLWCDLDSQIQNSDIRVEGIVEEYLGDGHFLWGYDHAGPNSGVYIVRFTSEARQWMDRVYATMQEQGLADETAMEILATTHPFRDRVRVCPGTVLNSYDAALYYGGRYTHEVNQYKPGAFILHMPGYPNEKRIPELKRRLAGAT